jgi:hypothetical protein
MSRAIELSRVQVTSIGPDLLVEGRPTWKE